MAKATCLYDDGRYVVSRGLCDPHYRMAKSGEIPLPPTKSELRASLPPVMCMAPGCDREAIGLTWCGKHKRRMRTHGTLDARVYVEGGRPLPTHNGYLRIFKPGHPLAKRDGFVLEHRMVAWDAGLLTDSTMEVHHLNEDKTDNRLENLMVETPGEHQSKHHCAPGMEIKNQYGTWIAGTGVARKAAMSKESLGPRSCEVCGNDISDLRADASVCGNNCRVTRWKRANGRKKRAA